MQTRFTGEQLADPRIRAADAILRKCVHCGFCNATCPTFRLAGDELEGPRGRIYLIKELLERGGDPGAEVVKHVDSCLSCLSCMTTCPSGVDYMHLVDEGRARIEERHCRPLWQRLQRAALAFVLTRPQWASRAFTAARALGSISWLLPSRLRPAFGLLAGTHPPVRARRLKSQYAAAGRARGRVALLAGCVQQAIGNDINEATIRVLNRLGFDVQVLADGCCGAVEQHLGRAPAARTRIRANVRRWQARHAEFDAILTNASGCGTMLKDYGHVLEDDGELAGAARELSSITADICEFLARQIADLTGAGGGANLLVAVQVPCSMRHGQRISEEPARLLRHVGYRVVAPEQDHLCCGSAGTYNLLQAETAARLGIDKAARLAETGAQVIASGNLGCMIQLRRFLDRPLLHTVQLLDWAQGGPRPAGI
jgi:glycolate oxidase iron-sulfur subunit